MFRFWRYLLVISVLLMAFVPLTNAQDDTPVVQIAFFYSPTCPHCHDVINNVLPGMIDQYGDQIDILYIDVSTQGGSYVFFDACGAVGIPEDRCGAVPTMIIGDEYMIGSGEIPARMGGLINAGLAAGGLDLSNLPMLWEALQAQRSADAPADGESANADNPAAAIPADATWIDRFNADVTANSIAVIILIALVISLLAMLRAAVETLNGVNPTWVGERPGWIMMLLATIGGGITAFSIVLDAPALTAGYALVVAALLITVLIGLSIPAGARSREYLIPALSVAELIVAFYLSYVEVGQHEAVCGIVGDCNAVQSSPYALVFGIPVGVIGVIGYFAILAAWVIGRGTNDLARWGQVSMLIMSLFGVGFSAYLTFLEPFVIGASCAWCLTSALVMIALLWLSAPRGWTAIQYLFALAPDSDLTDRIEDDGDIATVS